MSTHRDIRVVPILQVNETSFLQHTSHFPKFLCTILLCVAMETVLDSMFASVGFGLALLSLVMLHSSFAKRMLTLCLCALKYEFFLSCFFFFLTDVYSKGIALTLDHHC